jgi:ABC-type bacteriocin/lantibiotic exporter with double-glycine peptidase domain
VSESEVATLAGTTSEGTDEYQLMRALRKLRCRTSVVKRISTIRKKVLSGTPVIIHLDEELHWVVVIGCLGTSLIVFDSQKSKGNRAENGVRVLTPLELGAHVFGICVNRPTSL